MTFYMKRKKDEGAEKQMTRLFGSSLFMLTLILDCIMLFCSLFCFVFTETYTDRHYHRVYWGKKHHTVMQQCFTFRISYLLRIRSACMKKHTTNVSRPPFLLSSHLETPNIVKDLHDVPYTMLGLISSFFKCGALVDAFLKVFFSKKVSRCCDT